MSEKNNITKSRAWGGSVITMASLAFLMLVSMASQVLAQPSVAVMPSYSQSRTYANAALNEPITVWGRTWGGTAPYTYTLDFGDGNSVSGAVTDPTEISALHTYASGGTKTISLTVTDSTNASTTRTGTLRVIVNPTKDERVNMAIEKGLLYLYRTQQSVTLHGSVGAYWSTGYSNEYGIGELGSILAAYGENGHHANNSDVEDIYAETVRKAAHTVLTARSGTYAFSSSHNNDGNGNNPYEDLDGDHTGVYLHAGGHETYASSFAALGLIVTYPDIADAQSSIVSGGNLNGMSVYEVVQDVIDILSYSQSDGTTNRGGWIYNIRNTSHSNGIDGSSQQWPNLVFRASIDLWGLSPHQWVLDNVANGFRAVQNANGGVGYRSKTSWINTGKTGGALVGYNVAGLTTADTEVSSGLTYIGNNWRLNNQDPGWAGSFYHMYGLKKGLQLTGVETVTVPGLGAVNWYEDLSDWLMGLGPSTLYTSRHNPVYGFGQYPDGHWEDRAWISSRRGMGTAHAILILTRAVTIPLPVAVIEPVSVQPRNFAFQMDGSNSFHLDADLDIVLYQWDFNYDGSNFDVDASSTGALINNPGYALPGSYTVALRVTDNNPEGANSDLATTVVEVTDQNAPPVAVPIPAGQPAYSGRVGDTITLDGSDSFDPENDPIIEYLWDLDGNGTFGDAADAALDLVGDANTVSPQVTFTTIYNGLVGLKVTSEDGDGVRKSSSNRAEIDIIFSPSNLFVSSVSAVIVVPGEEANVTVTVENAADSGQGYTGVELQFFSSDPFLGGSPVGPTLLVDLPIGGSATLGPINLTGLGGAEEVFAFIDSNSAIGEYNETDNASAVAVSNTPPVVVWIPQGTAPDFSVGADCFANVDASAFYVSATDPDLDPLDISINPPGPFALGNHTVTVTVSDGTESQSEQYSFDVVDTTDPVLTVPADVILECPADTSVAANGAATATDNCSVTVTFIDEVTAECGNTQTIARTWTATDGSNNSVSGTQVIVVQDTTAPELVGLPADALVECDSVPAPAIVTATDNCGTADVAFSELRTDGNCPSNYVLTRTWVATDECGNSSSASQIITVQDNTAPVLVGVPANALVECDSVPAPAIVTATDNCGAADLAFSEVRTDGNCPSNYILTRTWVATDACGNSSSASQVIVVQDTTAPAPIVIDLRDITNKETPITFTATSSDNCGGVVVTITNVTRHKVNKKGKIIFLDEDSKSKSGSGSKSKSGSGSKSKSLPAVVIDGSTVTINDSGPAGTIITVYATAVDECGNSTDGVFTANVVKPPKSNSKSSKSKSSKSKKSAANEGVGNGVDGNTPGHDNNGGNDDEGNTPGNPGAKKKNKKK